MKQSIVHVALVVKDYDEAIDFYTKKLNFDMCLIKKNLLLQLKAFFRDQRFYSDQKRTKPCSFLSFFSFQIGKRWEILRNFLKDRK
ncbi:VOC family protein [Fulvivirgaceae bacterium BMA10]|uniref:VOC family protein n=1 Tax=Splendidivirga corallicola TaxID=3051826 RepID=A0ABT8KS41_9BACT|nr:VOC family protein [Fulvivirgaceae bacterium BMA10]